VVELDEVVGIIGPMTSPGATAVSAWIGQTHPEITLITPTATDEGIASLGSNIFQLNVPTARLARSIANYAVRCLNAHEFAILTPVSDYGRIMTAEFSNTVESLGGQVLTVQQYQEGGADFKTEFNRIRTNKLALDNRRRNISKGLEDASVFNPRDRKAYLDDSLISFDAVFIAASDPTDAASMASHVAFNKIGGKLLGSSGWYGRSLLADGKRLVDGAYFSVPFADAYEDATFQKFAKKFSARWEGTQPDKERVSGLSYDGMNIFLDSWNKKGSDNAKAILQKKPLTGVYGNYQFDDEGANSAQHIMTVAKGKFILTENCPDK
jgi:ABC-type branched-subunit amino acid transport system substrate-binding protein